VLQSPYSTVVIEETMMKAAGVILLPSDNDSNGTGWQNRRNKKLR
jgi:hypothetical protein